MTKQEILDRFNDINFVYNDSSRYDTLSRMLDEMLEEQESTIGEWIERNGYDGDVYYDCSACGESWVLIDGTPKENGMRYCPHCGAKMEWRW